jgi:hypothetical protein
LPEDSRGNKRVVVPKAEKAAARAAGKDVGGSTSNRSVPAPEAPTRARKNKRRR